MTHSFGIATLSKRAARIATATLFACTVPLAWAAPSPPLSCDGTLGTGGCPPYSQVIFATGRAGAGNLFEYEDIPLDYSETGQFGTVRGAVDLAQGQLRTYALGGSDNDPSTNNGVSITAAGSDIFTLHRLGAPSPDYLSFSAVMTATGTGQIADLGYQGLALLNMDAPAVSPIAGRPYDLQYFQAGRNVPVGIDFRINLMSFLDFSLPVEQPFQLNFGLRTDVGERMVFDLSHTAHLSFVLPEGVTITSMGGYNSATVAPVPEPSTWLLMAAGLAGLTKLRRTARKRKDIVMKNSSPLRFWPVAALVLSATPVSALATVCPTATIDQILALGICTIGDESFDFTHPQLPPHPVYFNGPFAGNTGLGPDAGSVIFTPDATAGNPGFSLTANFIALGQALRNSSFYGGLVSGNFYDEQLAYFGVTAGAGEGLTGYSVALTGAHVTQGTGGSIVVDLNSASTVVNATGFTRASDSRSFAPSVVGQQLFASYLKSYEPSANPADSAGYASVSYHFNEALIAAAVPEPQTYALMFAGLAVVASVARRRQRRS